MTRGITYAEACRDPNLFGDWFAGDSWSRWRVIDKALFGQSLDADELAIFRELAGHDQPPTEPVTEGWFVVGRRGGKDVKASSLVAYLSTIGAEMFGYRSRLVPGEKGVVQLLAVDREQAGVCLGYLRAFFEKPILAQMVKRSTADGIDLTNGLAVEIATNDQRRVRGRTVVAAVFDEVAFWRSEGSANPDEDVFRAIKPAMATIPGAMLIGISSPYARKGLLWKKHKANYGKPGRVLVVQAPTWVMNPNLPRDGEVIAEAYADDEASARAEYGANFRTDVEGFVAREIVEACVLPGVYERPRVPGLTYMAFVDPSGGSNDSMTLAVGHQEGARAVLDALRERKPPFNPDDVVAEFCDVLASYGLKAVTGDRYGGEWCRQPFRRKGIAYNLAEKTRSDLYRDMLPALNSGSVDLLDSERLVNQLVGLERRVARGGRDSIDHAPGAHDDLANAAAGALVACLTPPSFRYGMLDVVS